MTTTHAEHPLLAPICETFAALRQRAELHTPGGKLQQHDLMGLYRRTARLHGCTPEDVRKWVEGV